MKWDDLSENSFVLCQGIGVVILFRIVHKFKYISELSYQSVWNDCGISNNYSEGRHTYDALNRAFKIIQVYNEFPKEFTI